MAPNNRPIVSKKRKPQQRFRTIVEGMIYNHSRISGCQNSNRKMLLPSEVSEHQSARATKKGASNYLKKILFPTITAFMRVFFTFSSLRIGFQELHNS